MNASRRWFVSLILLFAVVVPALACLWDYDTLKQERARFPGALELITGKFLRHSPEFYEWRIKDRLGKLKSDPNNLSFHDDLAVAYQKTGQHEKAVETILAKEKIKPGLYETHSNLGTFYILAGQFEKGLPYIDKALAINPDAHFGREKYQKWLVEYALTRHVNGAVTFPLRRNSGLIKNPDGLDNFQVVIQQRLGSSSLTLEESQNAVKAVLGMMRFAHHDNIFLLEALGDLLLESEKPSIDDAKRLAARCYLKASYEIKDGKACQVYRMLADTAIGMQTSNPRSNDKLKLSDLEADFAKELADAQTWYKELKQREIDWINSGKDVEAEFDRLYTVEPNTLGDTPEQVEAASPVVDQNIIYGVSLIVFLLVSLLIFKRYRTVETVS